MGLYGFLKLICRHQNNYERFNIRELRTFGQRGLQATTEVVSIWCSLIKLGVTVDHDSCSLTSDIQQAILTWCTTALKQPKQLQLWDATNENVTVVGRSLPTVHIVSRMCMLCITTGRTKCVACNYICLQQKGGVPVCTALATGSQYWPLPNLITFCNCLFLSVFSLFSLLSVQGYFQRWPSGGKRWPSVEADIMPLLSHFLRNRPLLLLPALETNLRHFTSAQNPTCTWPSCERRVHFQTVLFKELEFGVFQDVICKSFWLVG